MSLSPRFGVKFFAPFWLVLGGCGRTVRAAFPSKRLILQTYAKTVFLGILSLVGLLALPPLATARDNPQGQPEGREHPPQGQPEVSEHPPQGQPEGREHRSRGELRPRDRRSLEAYLDTHWETARILYQQPELINDRQFLRDHRALRDWLAEHPRAARVIRANPSQVLWEQRGSHPQLEG